MTQLWMRKKPFAKATGVSQRTVARWLNMGLPSAKVGGGTRLIHVEKANAWLEEFMETDASENSEKLIEEIMKDFK